MTVNPTNTTTTDEIEIVVFPRRRRWTWALPIVVIEGLWALRHAARSEWNWVLFYGVITGLFVGLGWLVSSRTTRQILRLRPDRLEFDYGNTAGWLPWGLLDAARVERHGGWQWAVIPITDVSQIDVRQRFGGWLKQKPLTELRFADKWIDRPADQLVAELERFRRRACTA